MVDVKPALGTNALALMLRCTKCVESVSAAIAAAGTAQEPEGLLANVACFAFSPAAWLSTLVRRETGLSMLLRALR